MNHIHSILADVARVPANILTDGRSLALAINIASMNRRGGESFYMSAAGGHDVSGEARGGDGKWTSGGKTLSTVHEKLAALLAEHPEHAEHIQKAIAGVQAKAAAPVAKPTPVAKPAVAKAAPASPGRAAEVAKHVGDAYAQLRKFPEFSDGLVDLPSLYDEAKGRHPKLTLAEFHKHLQEQSNARAGELHVLNEVHSAVRPELAIHKNDSLYYYYRHKKTASAQASPVAPAAKPAAPSIASQPLPEFAKQVQAVANEYPHGFYDNKVFISDLYDHFAKEDPSLKLEDFKAKIFASRAHLQLGQANDVEHMHPADVARSQIEPHSGIRFHHVITPPNAKRTNRYTESQIAAAHAAGH